jgi:hypothetical protein
MVYESYILVLPCVDRALGLFEWLGASPTYHLSKYSIASARCDVWQPPDKEEATGSYHLIARPKRRLQLGPALEDARGVERSCSFVLFRGKLGANLEEKNRRQR